MAATASIQVLLKGSSTAISAKGFDDRSTEEAIVLIGKNNEVVVIPRDSIAAITMDPESASDYFDNFSGDD